ncbi:MAG: sulfurtransferase TusA family protein [Promethearchaeota archaeon]|jgi:TusA-related sulfurtransferase
MTDVSERIDLRGEVCPYPDVKSKRKIKKMNSGEVLEILIDYPLSSERIPETMKSLGNEVLSVEKTGNSEWKILVKAK